MAGGEVRFFAIGRDITGRKAVEEAIERQLDLEKRIAGLSRRFLALRTEEIDAAIGEALVEAAALAGADRCFLYSQGPDGNGRFASYEWCDRDVASAAGEHHPWSERRLAAGEILNFRSVDAFPPEAGREVGSLRERGVRSLLSIPIRSGDRTIGVLGFETIHAERTWPDHDVTLLQLIGEILTSALGRKHAEAALRESESKLLQIQKLEAVGRLAGGIAHDFNNLLTVILGFSRPLLRELEEDNPIREDLQEIHNAAERAASLTRQLLTFSRRQAVDEQVMDLSALVSGLKTLLERLLGEDVEFVLDLEPALRGVKGDPHQFEQVVINLAANARDAMPDGGTLRITTRNAALDAAQARRIGLPRAGRYVLLCVSDSGHGMDQETRASSRRAGAYASRAGPARERASSSGCRAPRSWPPTSPPRSGASKSRAAAACFWWKTSPRCGVWRAASSRTAATGSSRPPTAYKRWTSQPPSKSASTRSSRTS
jgi:signal transduction histidine kinase